jgi:purine nucleoside phosphorylase
MAKFGIIGGSGSPVLTRLVKTHQTVVHTPYGSPSSPLIYGVLGEHEVIFLFRRGAEKPIAPHLVNYRANLWALREAGVDTIIVTAAVASLRPTLAIGHWVLPHQLIDHTYGRDNTFFGDDHTAFEEPYHEPLRQKILAVAKKTGFALHSSATYGAMQGPRFETKAEIQALRQEGCDILGMTGMPESVLAKELSIAYACIAFVAAQISATGTREVGQPNQEKGVQLIEETILNY